MVIIDHRFSPIAFNACGRSYKKICCAHYRTASKRCQVCHQIKKLYCQHYCETIDKIQGSGGKIVSGYTTGHTSLPVISQHLPEGLLMHSTVDMHNMLLGFWRTACQSISVSLRAVLTYEPRFRYTEV